MVAQRSLDTLLLGAAGLALLGSFLIEFATVGFVPFFLIFLLPPLAFTAALLAWPRPWLHVAAAVSCALVALMFFASSASWLRHPMIFAGAWGQLGILLFAVAIVLALTGLVGWFAARRASAPPSWREGWPRLRNLAAIATVVFVFGMTTTGALVVSNPLEGAGYAVLPDETVAFALIDVDDAPRFRPADVPISRGRLVELHVTNAQDVLATLSFAGPAGPYVHDIPPGSTARILVRFDEAGEVTFGAASADVNSETAEGRFVVG